MIMCSLAGKIMLSKLYGTSHCMRILCISQQKLASTLLYSFKTDSVKLQIQYKKRFDFSDDKKGFSAIEKIGNTS